MLRGFFSRCFYWIKTSWLKKQKNILNPKTQPPTFVSKKTAENSKQLIKIENLTYDVGTFSLNKISFNIKEHEAIGIIGPNGAGKTTLIKCLIGLNKFQSGIIQYGFEKNDLYRHIGVQTQAAFYDSHIYLNELIELCTARYGYDTNYIQNLLKLLNLEKLLRRRVKKFSGGELQKVNFLLAIINKPKILILDEVTTFLDPLSRRQIIALIKGFQAEQHIGIIMVSHYLNELEDICKRFIFMRNGSVIHDGTIDKVAKELKLSSKSTLIEIYEALYKDSALTI